MDRDVVSVSPRARMPELERRLLEARVSGCPVVDDDGRLVGVVTRSDVIRRLCVEHSRAEAVSDYYFDPAGIGIRLADGQSFEEVAASAGVAIDRLRAADVMHGDVTTVTPDAGIQEAARLMIEHGYHRLPVVDGERLLGVVSTMDLARAIADGRLN